MNVPAAERVTSLPFLAAVAQAKNVDFSTPTTLSAILVLLKVFRKFIEAFQNIHTRKLNKTSVAVFLILCQLCLIVSVTRLRSIFFSSYGSRMFTRERMYQTRDLICLLLI